MDPEDISCLFKEEDLPEHPMTLFKDFQRQYLRGHPVMVLSTVTREGRPSSRALLFYGLDDEDNVLFFTNKNSRKGDDMAHIPFASALFLLLDEAGVQIRIDGRVQRASEDDGGKQTEKCGRTMPGMARILASAGHEQSKEVEDVKEYKQNLCRAYTNATKLNKVPDGWEAYKIIPDRVEFWGQGGYIVDRIEYVKCKSENASWEWKMRRLASP
eukprot:Nk52_evm70s217 gene=Nk52_evmTU70s217